MLHLLLAEKAEASKNFISIFFQKCFGYLPSTGSLPQTHSKVGTELVEDRNWESNLPLLCSRYVSRKHEWSVEPGLGPKAPILGTDIPSAILTAASHACFFNSFLQKCFATWVLKGFVATVCFPLVLQTFHLGMPECELLCL